MHRYGLAFKRLVCSVKAPAYDSQRIETFAVEDFGYVQHLNHFYDIDLIKTSPRILPVSIQSFIPQEAFIWPF